MKKICPRGRKIFSRSILLLIILGCWIGGYAIAETIPLTDIELLGKHIFFDKISVPAGAQGCVSCHAPETGGVDPDKRIHMRQVASNGAVDGAMGTLKAPTNAYATLIPPFGPCDFGIPGLCGGNFWNGRSVGFGGVLQSFSAEMIEDDIFNPGYEYPEHLGPVADQALNPFPNPVEQNISREGVCLHVQAASYAPLFEKVFGEPITCEEKLDVNYKRIAVSLAAWQGSPQVNSFTSKRDFALAKDADGEFPLDGLTDQENLGHDLFYGTISDLNPSGKDAGCSFCHADNPDIDTGAEPQQTYSDHGYHNIGTPRNPEIPGYPVSDPGLAGHTGVIFITPPGPPQDPPVIIPILPEGFIKTPTLRNVDKRPNKRFIKAFTQNGWFKSLESIVHFYNTADVEGATAAGFGITRCTDADGNPIDLPEKIALKRNCWPEPAFAGNAPGSPAIPFLLGDLGLTLEEEAALVAYMKTLTDLYTARPPKPYRAPRPPREKRQRH